jgi:hypothetical protein
VVQRASQEVVALRERFPTASHVQSWLVEKPPRSIWDYYNLAVSAGLAGSIEQSRRSFADVMSDPEHRPWASEIRRRSEDLMRYQELGAGFEEAISNTIRRTRGLLGLPL